MSDYEIEVVPAAEVRPLRRALLHGSRDLGEVSYEGDSHPSACHVGAFRNGVLIGIATTHPQPMPGGWQTRAWRIRDVAVDHGHRGRGVGALLLERLVEHIQDHEGSTLWGRITAGSFGFFERYGFRRSGDPIDDPEEGPHYIAYASVPPLVRSWAVEG